MSHLWNPHAQLPPPPQRRRTTPQRRQPQPVRDAARIAALKRLRHTLITSLSPAQPPVLAMERWLARSALRSSMNDGDDDDDDPLLPSLIDTGLVKDLSRVVAHDRAVTIAQELAAQGLAAVERVQSLVIVEYGQPGGEGTVREHARNVRKASKRWRKAPQHETLLALRTATREMDECVARLQCGGIRIVASRGGLYRVSRWETTKKEPYLMVSEAHVHKLLTLWDMHHDISKEDSDQVDGGGLLYRINSMPNQSLFLRSLYCCLARYEGLKGAGYQCAVPPVAFDAAQSSLGTTIECFASPFNCRYGQFCSAFPDIESLFGSMGNFFDDDAFFPLEGSFEANPPFVPETMTAMGDKVQRLLDNPGAKALSFLVIVPAWGAGMQFCHTLEASMHTRATARIPAAAHAFCDGAQHRTSSVQLRPSSWDTALIVLQNSAGAQQWPIDTAQLEANVCGAFRASNKSSAQGSLGEWEDHVRGKKKRLT